MSQLVSVISREAVEDSAEEPILGLGTKPTDFRRSLDGRWWGFKEWNFALLVCLKGFKNQKNHWIPRISLICQFLSKPLLFIAKRQIAHSMLINSGRSHF